MCVVFDFTMSKFFLTVTLVADDVITHYNKNGLCDSLHKHINFNLLKTKHNSFACDVGVNTRMEGTTLLL